MSWKPPEEELDELLHTRPECTGMWEQEHRGRTMYWRCSDCRTVYYDAPGVMKTALNENAMGKRLETLARAGQRILKDGDS